MKQYLSFKRQRLIAERILFSENNNFDNNPFWFGNLSEKKINAQKRANKYNYVLQGTKAKAIVQFARYFNKRGVDWGIIITDFDEKDAKLLRKKYDILGN